jgi:integrase
MNVRVIPHKRTFAPLVKQLGKEQALKQYRGPWAVDYYCPVTKKRKYERFDTQKQAVARKRELEGKQATGEYRPLHRRTWTEFVERFRRTVLANAKHKTRLAYEETIAHFERLCTPAVVANITTSMVDEFAALRASDTRGKYVKRPISKHTVNKTLTHLRAMLRVAHRWDYLPKLPEFRSVKAPDPIPRAIPLHEFEALLAEASNIGERFASSKPRQRLLAGKSLPIGPAHNPPGAEWWVAFLSVSYMAGLRLEETLNLKWGNLTLTAKPEIRVWNRKASRWECVPMRTELVDRLQALMAASEAVADNALVFPHRCHTSTVHKTWYRLQKWAGIERLYRFHDLRVSFCTNLVAAGVEAPTLMKLARHRSIATTMKHYRVRTDDADRRAIDRMFSVVEAETA